MKAFHIKTSALKTFLPGVFLLASVPLQAQAFDEWFRQKKTQREYLVQQIAALEAYAGVLREGYSIALRGISTVEHSKNGDLGLHQAFFGSLKLAGPAIGGAARIADILRYQAAIARDLRESLPALRLSGQLKENELEHLEKVRERLLASCARDLEALWLILTENEVEMRDAGRLERLEELFKNTLDIFSFTQAFLLEARVLAHWRDSERQVLESTRSLYGLPQ
ncbi:hypothetical protein ACFSKU_15425 [Pontibacter silvestris]|uniref:TerB family tellurite resistance protein n=1 Tax=Pontibacter silvestris TaxID=2305183 RepID=A0ABW4X2S4_9BACT|nr:hypothetical protein [Pontibacter silvestris]MCC9137516.1 hypothetical protein [Pontibacter silvestris]